MILRIARHTDDLDAITVFYTTLLGLEIQGSFADHDGYSGIFLGKEGMGWQLEFTRSLSPADHRFDEDDLLVFYPETMEAYNDLLARLEVNGIQRHLPKNPYWEANGILIKDPDGYGVLVSGLFA